MIEFFAVPPDEEAAFLAAWGAEASPGATLYRALREGVPRRFASLASDPPGGAGGVLLIVPFEVPAGEEDRLPTAWEPVQAAYATRRGYLGAVVTDASDARFVAVVHWSSPLMYARAVREDGDLIAALPFRAHPALYVRVHPPQ